MNLLNSFADDEQVEVVVDEDADKQHIETLEDDEGEVLYGIMITYINELSHEYNV